MEGKQVDEATDTQVAPKNVVIMHVRFIDTGDDKARLDGDVIGEGKAEIATNGRIVRGAWKKTDETDPTASSTPTASRWSSPRARRSSRSSRRTSRSR